MGQQINAAAERIRFPANARMKPSRLDRHLAFNIFKSPVSAQVELSRSTQDIAQEI